MVEVLHLAAVLPATVGLCCAVGDRRGRARSVVPAAAMLTAMLAMAAGWPIVPPLAWAALLVVLGVAAAAGLRRGRRAGAEPHVLEMQVHRALGLVLGAGLLVVSAVAHGGPADSAHGVHAAHATIASPVPAILAGTVGYLGYTAWIVARAWSERRRRATILGALEASAMGLMTAVMAIAPFVG